MLRLNLLQCCGKTTLLINFELFKCKSRVGLGTEDNLWNVWSTKKVQWLLPWSRCIRVKDSASQDVKSWCVGVFERPSNDIQILGRYLRQNKLLWIPSRLLLCSTFPAKPSSVQTQSWLRRQLVFLAVPAAKSLGRTLDKVASIASFHCVCWIIGI